MRIVKDKLSKGLGYPLKPLILQAAMEVAEVQTEATLFQHNGAFWGDRPLFQASFSPPGQLVDNQEEVLWISCRAMPGDVCNAARSALKDEIIPSFIAWITKLEALPPNSPIRREKQRFERDWQPPDDPQQI